MGFLQVLKKHVIGEEIPEVRRNRGSSVQYPSNGQDSLEVSSAEKGIYTTDINVVDKESYEDIPYIDLSLDLSADELSKREESKIFQLKKFLWDGTGKHPKEQKYLLKLDTFLLTSSMLGYFIKNLNQNNIATAYVNGLGEYYDMSRNQFNYVITLWTVGYVIGQIPSNLILHRISARYYLGALELSWALLTGLTVLCNNLPSLYAVRFLLGLLEAGFFPGMEYLLGSNYSASEISSRGAYFAVAGIAANMVSGPLQLALLRQFKNSSMPPFKWLFIIDAVISIPIAIYTMVVDPNTPSTTDAFYFDGDDRLVGLERRRRIGAQLNCREKYTWAKIKSFFNTWHVYVFPFVFLAYNNACSAHGQPTFTIWMKKALKFGPEKFNVIPTYYAISSIFVTLAMAYSHNWLGGKLNHYYVLAFFIPYILACSLLAVYDIPRWLHWISFWLITVPPAFGQPFIFGWINRSLFDDDMKRNFLVVVTNTLPYVTGAWVPIFTWDTRDQPRYFKGFTYTACLSAFGVIMTLLAWYFISKDEKRRVRLEEQEKDQVENI